MKYTLSIGLFSVLLLMGASCGKTADTNTNDTATTLANAAATVNTVANTTEVTEININTAANVNTTSGVTVAADDAEAGLEEPTSQQTTPATDSSAFSLSDITKHNTKADCWTAISGKVYDVSKYIARHPGGQVITQACGKDGTQLFATQGGEGQHSGTARSQLATFEIGTLK